MKRVRLRFAGGVEVDFVDRDLALRRVEDWAGRGMGVVHVVYGPEAAVKRRGLGNQRSCSENWALTLFTLIPLIGMSSPSLVLRS
ncbi:hypothetical protein [Vulcanisaeta sp. JCM 16159]|uniref:hypothetical protein n=1 Tax=Vulcanisaeta sp. JCM 16159 TaxID=1295371 RepID=UPI000B0C7902